MAPRRLRALAQGALLTLTLGLATAVIAAPAAEAAACTPAQLIGNPGFETASAPWTVSPTTVIGSFPAQPPHGGTRNAWLGGVGSTNTKTLSQSVVLPVDCTSATLTFWLHIDTTETTTSIQYDKLTVKLGSTTLATYSNLNKASGYQQRTLNVSAFAGQTATLTFTGTEDSSLQTSFVIDDVALDVAGGGTGADPTRTPANGAYTLNLTGDSTGANWTGHQSITFKNVSASPLPEVYLRLWDNYHGTCPSNQPIQISNVTGGTLGALEVSCTAVKITLPAPLAQNQTGTVGFDLSIAVPNGSDRFGRDGAYNFIGNAIPVLAVRDGAGWHLDPYTNNGESFYQLASNYTVALDHPTSVLTPASGTSTDAPGGSGRTITTATANNVREFAWVAGPFVKTSTTTSTGVVFNTYRTSGISASTASSMQSTGASAMVGHASRAGAYPYGEIDMILHNNFWFGGMEYPGIVLSQASSVPVIHELGHQWFYGIVGDDEYATPWLDEGFTDYLTDVQRGVTGTNCWNSVSWASSAENLTNSMAYWDAHSSRYSTVVYTYGKCALHDLRRLMGDSTFNTMLFNYAQSHWYGISTVADFKAAAQAATTTNLSSFWTTHRIIG